jgi:hypothetical protein
MSARTRGGCGFSSLMKPKKRGEICFVIYIAGERKLFIFIYEVFVKQKKKKRSANHYSHSIGPHACCILSPALIVDIIPVTLTIQFHIIPGLEPGILTK